MTFFNRFAFDGHAGSRRRWDGYAVRCDADDCTSASARVDQPNDVNLPPDWVAQPIAVAVPIGQKSAHLCPAHAHEALSVTPQYAATQPRHVAPVAAQPALPAALQQPVAPAAPASSSLPAAPAQALPPTARVETGTGLAPNAMFVPPQSPDAVAGPGATRLSETARIDVPATSTPSSDKQQFMAAGGGKVIVEIPKANGQA